MNERRWTLIVIVALVGTGCGRDVPRGASAASPSASVTITGQLGVGKEPEPVRRKVPRTEYSMVELIANPLRFQGADVGVVGYLVMDKVHEDEDDATLFLERESARMNITANALSVRFGPCRTRVALGERMLRLGTDPLPALPGYVMVRGILEPAPEDDPYGGATICAVSSVLGLEDPQQGNGAKSWWNTVARPLSSVPPWRQKPPGAGGRTQK